MSSHRTRPAHPARWLAAVVLTASLLPGAVGLAQEQSGDPVAMASSRPMTALTVGLGYIPSVQFAPFYVAQQSGAYAAAGLDITFINQTDTDLVTLIGQGNVDIGLGDGTSIITARSQEIPVRYVATIYADFPSVVVSKVSSGIESAADLKGRNVGTPGRYGSSWVMLQALLASADLTPDDLTFTLYPDYGQVVGLAQDQVDAATGFVNNEPVVLQLRGTPVNVLTVDDIVPLPGPGLVASEATLAAKHEALASFVAVTLGAMEQVRVDPQVGLDATFEVVPDLAADAQTQRAILDATIDAWSNDYTDVHGLGAIDPTAWEESVAFMSALPESPVAGPVVAADAFTAELLPVR